VRYPVYLTYVIILTGLLVASLWPDHRIWAFNWWGYYPHAVPIAGYIIGLLAAAIVWRRSSRTAQAEATTRSKLSSAVIISGITAVFTLVFVLLRTQTHFLGDGYTLLAEYASESPIIKMRNYGAMNLHLLVTNLLGGSSEANTLLSYRLLSITAGALLLAMSGIFGRALYSDHRRVLLFMLLVASGGYMLHFFGYVENYAFFIVAVAAFCMVGVAVGEEKINRWWLAVPLAVACVFHVFGFVLLPAAIYLLGHRTTTGRWLSRHRRVAVLALIALAAIAVLAFITMSKRSYYLQFTVVPLFENRFTLEDYTMFSWKHLVDFANLVFLLVPGALLLLVGAISIRRGTPDKNTALTFLIITSFCVLTAAFVIDPKLSMPRDWDLFAFAGIPLMILAGHYFLTESYRDPLSRQIIILAVALGFLVLIPRAFALTDSDIAIRHLRNYLALDVKKGDAARYLLYNYYKEHGDPEAAEKELRDWERDFPERGLVIQAQDSLESGNYDYAMNLARQAVEHNPIYSEPYAIIGTIFLARHKLDSAAFYDEIAVGLNPYSVIYFIDLGLVRMRMNQYSEAQDTFESALKLDPRSAGAILSLAQLSVRQQEVDKSFMYARRLDSLSDVPPDYFLYLFEDYRLNEMYPFARTMIDAAMRHGLDSTEAQKYLDRLP
jgi:hypothetical protein